MDIFDERKRIVKYLDENGWDNDKLMARKYFKKGQDLTIKKIFVGSWSSTVEFEEQPGKYFNTVMFEETGNYIDGYIEIIKKY